MNVKDLLETLHKHNGIISNKVVIGCNNHQLVCCTVYSYPVKLIYTNQAITAKINKNTL